MTRTNPISPDRNTAPRREPDARAVVGLQWGDEGKGKVIDILAARHDVVVRFNGGANAGHSIVAEGQRFAVHLLPSGVFRRGTESVIANGVVVDITKLAEEIEGLRERGISIPLADRAPEEGGLWLSSRAHVVTPYHKAQDALTEAWLAHHAHGESIGTTGRGIGPAYADKATRSFSIRAGDLLDLATLTQKVQRIADWKIPQLEAIATPRMPLDRSLLEPERVVEKLAEAARTLAPAVTDTTYLLHDRLDAGKSLLFEGANATLLDVDHGTYPFVTSSNTAAAGIATGTGLPPGTAREIVGVCKAYATRVGSGPFPTELSDANAEAIRERGNAYGTTTGRPRRVGWLDLVALRYAAMINGATSIALMLLDVLAAADTLKLCTAYRLPDGSTTDRFLPDAATLALAEPVLRDIQPFDDDITHARSLEALPANARRYLDAIEDATGLPISLVSVGPDRNQTIVC
jgi:adenylosuccinate synthase